MKRPDPSPPGWDRYIRTEGRVHLTGLQALARLTLDQVRRDRAEGRRVGVLISGYPGSPLAGFDQLLGTLGPLMLEHDVRLLPGLNEELAASTVAGTQLFERFPHSQYDGVVGIWYGKAPGLDRSLDAIRHSNFNGTSRSGGVLAVVGDDPACKSSSLPSHSEHAFAHAFVPLLSPADAGEVLELGEEEHARWRDAVLPLEERFLLEHESRGLPARALVRDMKALTAHYAAWSPEQIFAHVVAEPQRGIIDF